MSLELISAHPSDKGMAVTFATEHGIEPLEGSCDEFARLAKVMQQVSVLALANQHETVWIDDVAVGDSIVKLGLKSNGQTRVRILRP
jgi:hypothetical protein